MSSKPSVMDGKFQDGMAICAEYGKPDLFLTFTCNTSWPEIQRELKPGEKAQNQPVLVARVFYLYVKQLMKDILVGQIFGKIDAYLWVIEFQKRGLPHLHLLIILANHDRLITADFVDSLISAEILRRSVRIRTKRKPGRICRISSSPIWCMVPVVKIILSSHAWKITNVPSSSLSHSQKRHLLPQT